MALLEQSLQEKIDELIAQSDLASGKSDYNGSAEFLQQAWELLPNPKFNYDESYHLAKYLVNEYLVLRDFNAAKKWSETLLLCDLERIDSGEREFISGKVEFERGNLKEAKAFFLVANIKSRGRCFEGEDKKYKNLIKN
jgi:hypothetical protein